MILIGPRPHRCRRFSTAAVAVVAFTLALPSATPAQAQNPVQQAQDPAQQVPDLAQRVQDSVRVRRLAELGKVWNAARFLHPWLAYRPIDWDSGLVAAIPRVRDASSVAEYADALQGMLDALKDPITTVMPFTEAVEANPSEDASADSTSRDDPDPSWRWTDDRVLIVTITNYTDLLDVRKAIERMAAAAARVDSARAVIFDLRRLEGFESDVEGILGFLFRVSLMNSRLVADTIVAPGERRRMHSAYRNETGFGSPNYYSGWELSDGTRFFPGTSAAWRPIAFLVNARSEWPEIALALRDAGRAALIAAGGAGAAPVTTARLVLGDGLAVTLRLGERIRADGSGGFEPDTALPAGAPASAAMDAALATVRGDRPIEPPSGTALPVATSPAPPRAYLDMRFPSLPYRLLAAYRVWGVFEYFNPYRHLIEADWATVLKDMIPAFVAARDTLDYGRAITGMLRRAHDSHVNWRFVDRKRGEAWQVAHSPLPLRIRWIQDQPVVTEVLDSAAVRAGVRPGDIIVSVDGVAADSLVAVARRLIDSASTRQWEMLRAMIGFGAGPAGSETIVTLRGADGTREVRMRRGRIRGSGRTGNVFRMLPGNIGYADLDRLTVPQVDSMFRAFADADGIIFDMRGYPQGTSGEIARHLTDRERVPAARVRRRIVTRPRGLASTEPIVGKRTFEFTRYLPPPRGPHYAGRTVMLIDETAVSAAEHTGLLLEAANGTTFIGTPTAGANGGVTNFVVPGGIAIKFTGAGVRHADGRQLQRVGLQPDVLVAPTIRGIRECRDEVLERAVEYLRAQR